MIYHHIMISPKSAKYHPVAQTESAILKQAVDEDSTRHCRRTLLGPRSVLLGIASFIIVGSAVGVLRTKLDNRTASISRVISASTYKVLA